MGNDGGSIPKRRELVKEAARNPSATALKESQQEQQEYLWRTDPISQKPLQPPIVSDCNGKLYNKDTILELLVSPDAARAEEAERVTAGAVKGLRDVVEVRFESEDSSNGAKKGGDEFPEWKCPISGDRLGPPSVTGASRQAVYLVPCGHAFSATAVKEVAGERCVVCEAAYAANDVVPILPTAETDVARLLLRAKTLREKGLTHSLKKAPGGGSGGKKRKKRDGEKTGEGDCTEKEAQKNGTAAHDTNGKVNGTESNVSSANGINNPSTASLTAKVLEEGEMAKKRRRDNDNVRSLFSSKDSSKSLLGNNADFMTRGFSVPGTNKR